MLVKSKSMFELKNPKDLSQGFQVLELMDSMDHEQLVFCKPFGC